MKRIKTEQEFINEFGKNWKGRINWTLDESMDYLFGREITLPCYKIDSWHIDNSMITDKPLQKPKFSVNFIY